jgi:mono/diheme cytochrome c family protein
MKRSGILEVVLLGGILLLLATHFAFRPDPNRRNFEFLPEMVVSPAAGSFSAHAALPGGATLQLSPEGTIARGFLPLVVDGVVLDGDGEWDDLPEEQRRAWDALASPLSPPPKAGSDDQPPETEGDGPPSEAGAGGPSAEAEHALAAAALERGRRVFLATCTPCHSRTGEGTRPVTERGVPPPPSFLTDNLASMSDGRLFRIITHGQGNMPGHGAAVEREDRWKLVRYLRSLSRD